MTEAAANPGGLEVCVEGGGGGSVEEIKSIETEVEAGVKSSVVTSLLHIEPVVESQWR